MTGAIKRVVGVDLSLTSTGIARTILGAAPVVADVLTIGSKGQKADSWDQRHQRLYQLVQDITHHVLRSSLVMLEAPSYGSATGSQHDRSGLWWMVYSELTHTYGLTVVPVPPTLRAKYATGKGNASKDAVLAAAVRRYPAIDISGNDIADAVILMAIGCRLLGHPIDDMPAAHLSVMDKIRPPANMAPPAQEK